MAHQEHIDQIFENVMTAMQPAEEISGPTTAQYVALMERIAHEAQRRADVVRDTLAGTAEEVDDTPMQESPTKKAAWLADAQRRVPIGTRVRILNSDVNEYIGATGEVVDYNLGLDGDWPLVCVRFDAPIAYGRSRIPSARDGFYFDGPQDVGNEIEVLP